jgi:putative endonuclease
MFYVYALMSLRDNGFYVGFTEDLKNRFILHSKGEVKSTRNRRPLKLVYYEASMNIKDALKREKYLKTTWGKRYLRNRIGDYIEEQNLTG